MKNFFILFFISIVITTNAQKAVQGKVVYEEVTGKTVQYIQMQFSPSAYIYTKKQRLDEILVQAKSYNNTEDSLADIKKNEIRHAFLSAQSPQMWFGDLDRSDVLNWYTINKKTYSVSDTLHFVKWVVQPDTTTIDGFLCQKALGTTATGSKIVGWFAPAIPVAVAPYTLRGLPGLLVQAKYESGTATIKMLSLEWPTKEAITIAPPNNVIIVSKDERKALIESKNAEALKLAEYYKKQMKQ